MILREKALQRSSPFFGHRLAVNVPLSDWTWWCHDVPSCISNCSCELQSHLWWKSQWHSERPFQIYFLATKRCGEGQQKPMVLKSIRYAIFFIQIFGYPVSDSGYIQAFCSMSPWLWLLKLTWLFFNINCHEVFQFKSIIDHHHFRKVIGLYPKNWIILVGQKGHIFGSPNGSTFSQVVPEQPIARDGSLEGTAGAVAGPEDPVLGRGPGSSQVSGHWNSATTGELWINSKPNAINHPSGDGWNMLGQPRFMVT